MYFLRLISIFLWMILTPSLSTAIVIPQSYTYSVMPDSERPDDTGRQLIDGQFGQDNWRLNGAYDWVTWLGATPEVLFDFGSEVNVSSLSIGYIRDLNVAIHIPYLLEVSWSPDGIDFGDPWRYTIDETTYPNPQRSVVNFDLSGSQGRYARVDMLGGGWAFIDEVQFYEESVSPSLTPVQVGSLVQQTAASVPEPSSALIYLGGALGTLIMRISLKTRNQPEE